MPKTPSLPAPLSENPASLFGLFAPAIEYLVDAAQRSVLFLDVMRQRGNQYREHLPKPRRMFSIMTSSLSSTAASSIARSITLWCASFRLPASKLIRRGGRSSSSIRAPAMAGNRRLQGRQRNRRRDASGASLLFRRLPARSDARARRSKTSRAPKRCFSKRSSRCTRTPTASPA